ncbi:MAG TPA: hypothetical protein VET27_12790 [Mycobacterium sp.]|nr:hypothetical protein [Mycobacterium sp.]
MRKLGMTVAAAALTMGTFTMTPLAQAAQVAPPPPHPIVATSPALPPSPIQMMNCDGGTGAEGCGPGFIWHDGWRGFACYPC